MSSESKRRVKCKETECEVSDIPALWASFRHPEKHVDVWRSSQITLITAPQPGPTTKTISSAKSGWELLRLNARPSKWEKLGTRVLGQEPLQPTVTRGTIQIAVCQHTFAVSREAITPAVPILPARKRLFGGAIPWLWSKFKKSLFAHHGNPGNFTSGGRSYPASENSMSSISSIGSLTPWMKLHSVPLFCLARQACEISPVGGVGVGFDVKITKQCMQLSFGQVTMFPSLSCRQVRAKGWEGGGGGSQTEKRLPRV